MGKGCDCVVKGSFHAISLGVSRLVTGKGHQFGLGLRPEF